MNTTTAALPNRHSRGNGLSWVANNSIMEAFGAIATIALAIVGLAGVFSPTMAAIGVIIVGAAVLMESDFFSVFWTSSRTGSHSSEREALETPNALLIGSLTGVVLGILALLGVSSATLLSVAILVYGASFLVSGATPAQNNWMAHASGGDVLVGLGTIVLGLLAVIGVDSLTLVLVALLTLGVAALFSHSAPIMREMTHHS
jgi:hypothetical protein